MAEPFAAVLRENWPLQVIGAELPEGVRRLTFGRSGGSRLLKARRRN